MILETTAALGVLALLTVLPGPDMAVVTRSALGGGRGDGLRTASGVVVGLLVWGSLAVLGLTAVVAASPTAYLLLKVAGAVYLLWLGVLALRAGRGDPVAGGTERARRTARPWLTGLTTNLLNPKIALFYAGLLPALAPPSLPPRAGMVLLVLAHAAMTMLWLAGCSWLLTRARSAFARPGVRRAVERVTGVVLIGFGLRLVSSAG